MNQIFNAISAGYSSKQIIDYIIRQFPQHKDKIQNALAAGYTTERILQFLTGGRESVTNNFPMKTEHERTVESERQQQSRERQAALATGGAIAAPLFAPMAEAALSRAAPQILQKLQPSILGTAARSKPNAMPGQSQMQSPISSNISQQPPNVNPSNIQQSSNIPQSKTNITDIFNKYKGFTNQIDKLKATGNNPEQIAAYFKNFNPTQTDKIENESGLPIEEMISKYLKSQDLLKSTKLVDRSVEQEGISPQPIEKIKENEHATSELQVPGKTSSEILPETSKSTKETKPAEAKPIAKKDIVETSQGIGEIRDIKEKHALVEIDGKLHKVPVEDIEKEPKDIADLYDDLFNAIPDEYKSRMMNFAGYDEENNELLFRPHGGAAYVYKDIPSEFAEQLKNRLHRAKTTGKNMYGMWYEGDPSYGAGMSKLIKELQAKYGGRGKEYIRKYMTLFDILGIPHEEKKRKEREERERNKRNG